MSTEATRRHQPNNPLFRDAFPPGTAVEVRNHYSMGWAHGFEIAAVEPLGCRLRRLSDGYILPTLFDLSALRQARDR